LGVETTYALLSFARPNHADAAHTAALGRLDVRLPAPTETTPYLAPELTNLPMIRKPRVEPRRLSTGHTPLEIARVGSSWRISCTGCGEASPAVQFRWQVLEQTVPCRCT
jgi:hypothetical protein